MKSKPPTTFVNPTNTLSIMKNLITMTSLLCLFLASSAGLHAQSKTTTKTAIERSSISLNELNIQLTTLVKQYSETPDKTLLDDIMTLRTQRAEIMKAKHQASGTKKKVQNQQKKTVTIDPQAIEKAIQSRKSKKQ